MSGTVSVSVNEAQVLGQKAARGAGAYPAQAAHFGRALSFHLAAGRPAHDLVVALDALPAGPIQTMPFAPEPGPLSASYSEALAAPDSRPALPARLALPLDLKAQMERLAQNTYVPATESSRAAGAGAGLTDND